MIEVESLLIGLLAGQAEELSSYLSRDWAVSVPLLTNNPCQGPGTVTPLAVQFPGVGLHESLSPVWA